MLGSMRSRRLATVACLLGASGTAAPLAAPPLAAQPLAAQQIPAGDAVAPTLLSDCDITVQSCGTPGGELYTGSGYGEPAASGGSGSAPLCGAGWRVVCKTQSAETCAQWVIVEASGTVTFSVTSAGIGGSITQVCSTYVTNTLTFYIYS
jgi:hypothetical protein